MAAFDYVTAVYRQLWSLVDAHAPAGTAIKAGNRVRMDGDRVDPVKPNRQPADFPELLIEPGDFTDSWFDRDATLGILADDFVASGADWTEVVTQDYTLTLTHRDPRLGTAEATLDLELLTAIRKAGPRLGLPYVSGVSVGRGRRARQRSQGGGAGRAVTTIPLTVTMEFYGRQLVA